MTIKSNNYLENYFSSIPAILSYYNSIQTIAARKEFEEIIIEILKKEEHSSPRLATLASHILSDPNSNETEKSLAGSVLSNAKDKVKFPKVIGRYNPMAK